jgi:protoporphyrinogen oxidase
MGVVRLNSTVNKVVIVNGEVKGVEVAGKLKVFDKLKSTIPLPYVPKLMPDLPSDVLDLFKAINNIAVVCVIVKLRKQVTEYFWLNTNDPEMDIPGLIEFSNL